MQIAFSTLWDGYLTNAIAKKARNERAKDLRVKGYKVKCCSLRDQKKPYDGLGQVNGGSCTVYMLEYNA
jgi:hypothetical protein